MTDRKTDLVEEPTAGYGEVYTYTDYMKFQYEEMVELIRGKIIRMSVAPRKDHQQISMGLSNEIYNYLKDKPCSIFAAPFDVVLPIHNESKDKSTTVVQPDLCIICDESKLDDAGCFGAPDWVIEILSPSTSKKDLTDKYSIYEESGVKEYWVIMPRQEIVEVFLLEDGKYARKPIYTPEDIATPFTFPDLHIELAQIFPNS